MEKDILIVGEDHSQTLQDAISNANYKYKIANDLRGCLDIIREAIPNLIIVDHEALGEQSVEICETLKKYPGTQRIPLIFIAPKNAVTSLLEVLYIPVDDYIFFPLDIEDFKIRVQVLVDLQSYKHKKTLMSVEEKIGELEKLLELFPDYHAARQELGEIYEKTENTEAALKTLLGLAEGYYQQNNFGMAMDVITRMKRMIAEKSVQLSGGAQFHEALERCFQILGKE
ncbi:hypothetical protein [Candidatus Uabimicrobium sp. HlEnr_7]|uniref:hypothetical protein n=1 Tax=Candidatus Uabimicrobium helgolandensis TaxID=3095367 RepID=UPI0035560983